MLGFTRVVGDGVSVHPAELLELLSNPTHLCTLHGLYFLCRSLQVNSVPLYQSG